MPILSKDIDLHPVDLLESSEQAAAPGHQWWALYTRSRREKDLMRRLRALDVGFYSPLVAKRNKSPGGRVRTSYLPLFPCYVFLYGDESDRYEAMTTNCISRWMPVPDGAGLVRDLQRIYQLINTGVPVTPEATLQAGDRVRITSGTLKGLEGVIIRHRKGNRLLVAVDFLSQGASVEPKKARTGNRKVGKFGQRWKALAA